MASRFVYTEALKDQGYMSGHDVLLIDTLLEGIESMAARIGANPGAVLFLAPPMDVLMKRLGYRGQVGDDGLGHYVLKDYLRRHEELAHLYTNLGYELLVCREELTPAVYAVFEDEFYSYLK